jgi:hypothetical protein
MRESYIAGTRSKERHVIARTGVDQGQAIVLYRFVSRHAESRMNWFLHLSLHYYSTVSSVANYR